MERQINLKALGRNTNLEILRIISMILIVISHTDDFTGLTKIYETTSYLIRLTINWLNLGGQIGVGCFLLISGYFMVEQKITLKKILRLLGEVWFYTISIWLIYFVVKIVNGAVNPTVIVNQAKLAFFPTLFSHYWFVTAYVILMVLSPFLNNFIFSMDKRTYQLFLLTILTIFVVINGGMPSLLSDMSKGRLIPVFIIYFISGYIKRYVSNENKNPKKHFIIAIVTYILLYCLCTGMSTIGGILNNKSIIDSRDLWRPLNSPFIVITSVELFLGFLRIPPKSNKIINMIASNTFGIYLIHCNKIMFYRILPVLFPVYKETNPLLVFIYSISVVVIVYITCSLIDMVRQRTVEKLWLKFLDNHLCDIIKKRIQPISKQIHIAC